MRSIARQLVPGLFGGLLLLAGGKPAAPVPPAAPQGGSIEISANGLHIQPGKQVNYLRFRDGVRISGQGFSLEAETVELDVAARGIVDTSGVRLPKLEDPPERVIADPGRAVQQMAKEIRGPSTKLEASAVKRIAASGGVVIAGPGLRLSTATLYSSDGGASWSTAGTSQLTLDDKRRGQRGSFSADLMSFNVKDQTLLARGHLSGALAQAGQDPVAISAGELRADLQRNRVTIGGGLRLSMGGLTLSTAAAAAPVALDLASKEVRLDGGFTLSDSAQGLDLQGSGLTGSLGAGKQVNVGGGVRLSDAGRGLLLTADKLAAVLEPLKLTASGRVHLEYGKSSYEAQQAVVTRQGSGKSAKYVVEMAGPQKGRIDLDELQQKQAAAAAGKD